MSFSITTVSRTTLLMVFLVASISDGNNESTQCLGTSRNLALYSSATFPGTGHKANNCTNQSFSVKKEDAQQKYSKAYKWSKQNQFKVYSFKLQGPVVSNIDTDVTLVTQLTFDRLAVFENLCKQWAGPISAAIYIQDNYIEHFKKYFSESKILSTRQNIACHIVKAEGEFYPINYLRNVALQNSQTNYNFLNDVDFLPSKNMYGNIREKITSYLHPTSGTNKTCLVIPAFELTKECRNNTKFPETKEELLHLWNSNKIVQFSHISFPFGHDPTNYRKWVTSDEPYFVNWAAYYEPYIVIDKNAPKYDTNFLGYGFNKISHLMEVAASGYKFLVMHDSFIIHMPHMFSGDKIVHKKKPYFLCILNLVKFEFLINVKRKYGDISFSMVEEVIQHERSKSVKWLSAFAFNKYL